ncbi:MAG TPA: FkbM family methyltransferase [Longimicrobiales bacterium]|nr:FkbM family methyltransferase [Longimicrobiales bacterium]
MKRLVKAVVPKKWRPEERVEGALPGSIPGKARFAYDGRSVLDCSIAYNKYGGYCVPTSSSHRPAAKAVLSGAVYEPKTLEYMIEHCGPRDVVHAGTFFGDFLPALSGALEPGALLWAFEPNHESFRCARITIELNGLRNVRLTNAGIGARRQQLYVETVDAKGRALGGASRIVEDTSGARAAQPVDIVAIDDVVPGDRDVGIMQLDLEGYEEQALMGAVATIRRCLPILIVEVMPRSTLEQSPWFSDSILGLGYERLTTLHENSVYVPRA